MRSTAPTNLTCSRKAELLNDDQTTLSDSNHSMSPRSSANRERAKTTNTESTSTKMYSILIDSFKVNRSPIETSSPREIKFTNQKSTELYSGVNIYQQSLKAGGNLSARPKATSSVEMTPSEHSCSNKSQYSYSSKCQSNKVSVPQTSDDNHRKNVGIIPLNLNNNALSRPRSQLVTSMSARAVMTQSHTQQIDHHRVSVSASNSPRYTMSMKVPLHELPPPPSIKPPDNPYQTPYQPEFNYNRPHSATLPLVQVIN